MKPHRLFLASLFLATTLLAQPLAVFSRHEARAIGSPSAAPADRTEAAFFSAYSANRTTHTAYAAELPLITPPAWGKTIADTTGGTVHYLKTFPHGFVCHLQLHSLAPGHAYILCLNGNPEKAGNALLPTPVPGNEAEKYYDFRDVKSDAHGGFDGEFGVFLQPGAYDVRLYVKDAADFKIVLYRDFFPFIVQ